MKQRFIQTIKQRGLLIFLLFILFCSLAASYILFRLTQQLEAELEKNKLSPFYTPPLTDGATYDYLAPLHDMSIPDSDSTIVCLGNITATDSTPSTSKGLGELLQEMTGATVYDCTIPHSYASSYNVTFYPNYPLDVFSFYWLTTSFCVDNKSIYETVYAEAVPFPQRAKEVTDLLFSIDFNTVDYIFIAYDGSDYLAGRASSNPDNPTDIQTYAGSLAAGIELIKFTYPDINIVLLGAPYAYAYDENCNYADSRYYDYGEGNMPAFISVSAVTAATRNVPFFDMYFDAVTYENASEYLIDNRKVNTYGLKAMLKKVLDCFNSFSQTS